MVALVVLVVVIACAVAMAPYIGLVALVAIPLAAIALLIAGLAHAEVRFAAWYDRTRMARWLAGPPTVTLTVPGNGAAPHADRVAETPRPECGGGERVG